MAEQEARDAASAPPPAAGKAGKAEKGKAEKGKAAKPAAKGKAAAPAKGGAKPGAAAAAADAGPSTVRWQAGRPLVVLVSAVDAVGELDPDLDTVVLLEAPLMAATSSELSSSASAKEVFTSLMKLVSSS